MVTCYKKPAALQLKIEDIIYRIQDDKAGGVPIRTVKSFLSKIPSVVTALRIVPSVASVPLRSIASVPRCFDTNGTSRTIEGIIYRIQDDKAGGVPIRTVKSFMSKIPSVVTGEAIHLGSLIAAQGYLFPISDHVLTLKDDGTFYRFQVSQVRPQYDTGGNQFMAQSWDRRTPTDFHFS
ncbi:UNVERIFIED_CONTAM: hypothetical protein FKN15_048174 [Acipenser sinensis]